MSHDVILREELLGTIRRVGTAELVLPVFESAGILRAENQALYRLGLDEDTANALSGLTSKDSIVRHDQDGYHLLIAALSTGGFHVRNW